LKSLLMHGWYRHRERERERGKTKHKQLLLDGLMRASMKQFIELHLIITS
jgi:hypothetical protein